MSQLRMETTAVAVVSSSGVPTFAQVLEELNALRTILFAPQIGTRLPLNEDRRLDLAHHLNRIQEICAAATRPLAQASAPPQMCPHCGKAAIVDSEGPTHWYLCCNTAVPRPSVQAGDTHAE